MSDAPSSTIDMSQEEGVSITTPLTAQETVSDLGGEIRSAATPPTYVSSPPLDETNPQSVTAVTSTPDATISLQSAQHPAEVSGPSANSDLQLMSMPGEIRHQIWKHAVTKPRGDVKVEFSYDNCPTCTGTDHESLNLQIGRGWGKLNRGYKSSRPGFFVDLALYDDSRISILLACRQIHSEAVIILYGENHFVSHNVQGFCDFFVGDPAWGIGQKHAAMIKSITLGVYAGHDQALRYKGTNDLGKFATFICSTLCGLQHAKLTGWFMASTPVQQGSGPSSSGAYDPCWSYERSGLLSAASYVTESHPILKKAVWSSSSGGREVHAEMAGYFGVDFVVNLVPEGTHALTAGKRTDINGQIVDTRDIVLDCPKIRNTSLEEMLQLNEMQFALPDDAKSSEPINTEHTDGTQAAPVGAAEAVVGAS